MRSVIALAALFAGVAVAAPGMEYSYGPESSSADPTDGGYYPTGSTDPTDAYPTGYPAPTGYETSAAEPTSTCTTSTSDSYETETPTGYSTSDVYPTESPSTSDSPVSSYPGSSECPTGTTITVTLSSGSPYPPPASSDYPAPPPASSGYPAPPVSSNSPTDSSPPYYPTGSATATYVYPTGTGSYTAPTGYYPPEATGAAGAVKAAGFLAGAGAVAALFL